MVEYDQKFASRQAPWEDEDGSDNRAAGKRKDWEEFSNLLGYKELGRLDKMDIRYHVLPPGVKYAASVFLPVI